VRIYNRALSAGEVLKLYNNGMVKMSVTPQFAMTANLIGWWTFDGKNLINNVVDTSGNGRTGYLSIGFAPTTTVAGKIGQGFLFDGVNDVVNIADNAAFSFTNGSGTDSPFSISTWAYINNITTATTQFMVAKTNASQFEWLLGYQSSTVRLEVDESLGTIWIGRQAPLTVASHQGQWTHIVATYSGSETNAGIKVYLNGAQADNANNSAGSYTGMTNGTALVTLGASDGATNFFPGQLDDARIYNRELTATEVLQLYNLGRFK
jgi:hypothetical protein